MVPSWWAFPGPERFIDRIFGDLREGRSVIASLPITAPPGLLEAASRRAAEEAWRWRALHVNHSLEEQQDSPIEFIYRQLGPAAPSGPTIRTLLGLPNAGSLLLWIDGIRPCTAAPWLRFAADYETQGRGWDADRPLFCLVVTDIAQGDLPGEGVVVAVRSYSDAINSLDTLLFTTRLLEATPGPAPLQALRAAICAELAGADPSVAYRLASETLDGLLDPEAILRARAIELGWSKSGLLAGPSAIGDRHETWNGRRRLQSAAVALAGDRRELERRIWRAQVQVLFPLLEEIRVHMVEEIRDRARGSVSTNGQQVRNLQEMELAELRSVGHQIGVPRKLQEALDAAAAMRNHIAHLQIVPGSLLRSRGFLRAAE